MHRTCPNTDELVAYTAGRLPVDRYEGIEGHLIQCSDCQADLGTIDESHDTFLSRLREPGYSDPFLSEPECRAMMARVAAIGCEPSFTTQRQLEGPAEAALDLGDVGPYRLLAKLGAGGMGAVYKALHTRLKRVVALKMLSPERVKDEQAVARFEREMEAVGKLEHANIVLAHDAGEFEGKQFLVMEYIDGVDLSQLVASLGPLPIAEACELIRQAAVGLQHAHTSGLVHRDIKPSNLMLTPEGIVKILDLGLALLPEVHGERGNELTSTGQAMGTLNYMPPEQAGDSHDVDSRADIYSLGATLYKLLTGEAIYSGPQYMTARAKWHALVSEEATPVEQRRPDVPAELGAILHRMIAKEKEARYSHCGEVADALVQFAGRAELATLLTVYRETESRIAAGPPTKSTFTLRGARPAESDTNVQENKPVSSPAAKNLAWRLRTRRGLLVAILLLMLAGSSLGAWQIIIRIRDKAGRETVIRTADGSTITIESAAADDSAPTESKPLTPSESHRSSRNRALRLNGRTTFLFVPELQYHGQWPLTVEGWCYPESDKDDPVLISDAFGPGFSLKLSENSGWKFLMAQPRGWHYSEQAGGGNLKQWTHVAAVWDWKEMRLYVNGRLKTTVDFPRNMYFPSRREVAIGAYPAGDHQFVGLIDEVRISKEAIYTNDFTPDRKLTATDSTIALFRFDSESGKSAMDESGNKNHGIIHNPIWVDVKSQ